MRSGTAPSASFVTGATGFLGSNLVVELLARGRGRVHCLVRPSADAADRLVDAVRAAAHESDSTLPRDLDERLVAVPGDVTAPGLGLDSHHLARLRSAQPVEVWHAAASLRYEDEQRDDILRVNVDGTSHVVDFASRLGIAELHHVSTAYVAGRREGTIEEGPYDGAHEPNNWYEVSKRRGEDLVVAHAQRFDRLQVHRPSIIVGSSTTHRSTSRSGYYGFLSGLDRFRRLVERAEPGYLGRHPLRMLGTLDAALDLVPIDAVVAEAVSAADDPHPDRRYLHLTNPHRVTLARLQVALAVVLPDLRIELVDDRAALRPFDVAFDDAIEFYRPYLGRDQRFLRARDGAEPPANLLLDDRALVGLSVSHFRRSATTTIGNAGR